MKKHVLALMLLVSCGSEGTWRPKLIPSASQLMCDDPVGLVECQSIDGKLDNYSCAAPTVDQLRTRPGIHCVSSPGLLKHIQPRGGDIYSFPNGARPRSFALSTTKIVDGEEVTTVSVYW